jgi:hypothetical protein
MTRDNAQQEREQQNIWLCLLVFLGVFFLFLVFEKVF